MNKTLLIIILVGIVFTSGCISNNKLSKANGGTKAQAKQGCIKLCQQLKGKKDLSKGPCLSDNNPNWNIENWVCDVAHKPRQSIDNKAENQCKAFREGKARHFIEVDPNCNFIRTG